MEDATPPVETDGAVPTPDTGTPPPKPTCAQSPLPLTRFPAALRTTKSGRTFTGWGGAQSPGVAQRHPVILIHGNGGTGDEWKPFRQYFCNAGYGDLEIWAITFQDNSCVGMCSSGSNEEHAEELETLVSLVRSETQAKRVTLVAISMGVPTARYYMKFRGGLARDEVSVAYLVSGPNHGLPDCDVAGAAYWNVACAELSSSSWNDALNKPDETPNGQGDGAPPEKAVVYRTVSFTEDPFFYTSSGDYVSSPKLQGADNLVLPGKKHAVIDVNDLLTYLGKATPKVIP
jgi:pimeloyl-ACP methyl ester carboxylesterase